MTRTVRIGQKCIPTLLTHSFVKEQSFNKPAAAFKNATGH